MFFPYFAMAGRATTIVAPAWRSARRASGPTPLRGYFDRLVEFALAADWGRRPIPRAGVADARRSAPPCSRRPRAAHGPARGRDRRTARRWRWMTSSSRLSRARRVVPRGGDARPRTCTSAGSRCSRRPPMGALPQLRRAARAHRAAPRRARRATARSSRRSRSGCTPRSGSMIRHSRSIATSTGRRARLRDLVDEVMSMPLRRDRPLWEMWICEDAGGASSSRSSARPTTAWSTASRRSSSARCCSTPPRSPPPASPRTGARRPSPGRAAAGAGRARPPRRAARRAALAAARGGLAGPRGAGGRGGALRVTRALSHSLRAAPASVLNGPLSPLRRLAWTSVPSPTCRASSAPTARRSTT